MLTVVEGNLFTSRRQTLVNPVNCVGVMGAGVALEFKLRYPAMFRRYESLCQHGRMEVGKLWLYRPDPGLAGPWVLNFPAKKHWRFPSRIEYLELGLDNFAATYDRRGIESVAFPVLGSHHGGLSEARVLKLMKAKLGACEIPVDVYKYDPEAKDELIDSLKSRFSSAAARELAALTGIEVSRVGAIQRALKASDVRTVGQLAGTKGVGEKTLSMAFAWMRQEEGVRQTELGL